jgi:hypothetical protein
MPKILIIAAMVVCGSFSAFAQGSVVFSNFGGTPFCLFGNRLPVGSTYQVELMYAPDGTPAPDFAATAVRIGTAASFGPVSGFFAGGGRTVDSITPAGGFGLFQVRVWESAYGNSYIQVFAGPIGFAGHTSIIRVDTGNPTIGQPNASLVAAGLGEVFWPQLGDSGACIPEPSTIFLTILSLGAVLPALRAKSLNRQ